MLKNSIVTVVTIVLTGAFFSVEIQAQTHPVLISPVRLAALRAGGAEWNAIKKACDDDLDNIIDPGYAGFDWHDAVINYATAYQVLKTNDATAATKYAKKALALMKVLAYHHNYGALEDSKNGATLNCFQFIGTGDGVTKDFTLPMAPQAGSSIQVVKTPIRTITETYSGSKISFDDQGHDFLPILRISDVNATMGGTSFTDYRFLYRDGLDIFVLSWGNTHPAQGSTYYVRQTTGKATAFKTADYAVSGTKVTFATPPTSADAIFVRMIGSDYTQTGNFMGGVSSVQPDGPGYQMRTFNPGLAYGIDLLFDFPGLTVDLKTKFVSILNEQLEWYDAYGYENDGTLGNYFIEGLVTATLYTAYGTDGINTSSQKWKTNTNTYLQNRILNALNTKLLGGYSVQGQYAEATYADIITAFSLYKDVTGTDLFSRTAWTGNMIRATIHATKPDRKKYDQGGDWSDLPAKPIPGMVNAYLTYLPDGTMAPYARQYLKDIGEPVTGTMKDYKTDFPLSRLCEVSSPVYARSDWSTNAVWMSFTVGEPIDLDHVHQDNGHLAITKGADDLLINGGQYGALDTKYNNTLLFDDRGAGDNSNYPPGQGGFYPTSMTKYKEAKTYVYSQGDFTDAYENKNTHGNSVKVAVRSVLYIRPGIILVHDQAKTASKNVKKIFNLNFPVAPVKNGDVYSVTTGSSALYLKDLIPAATPPVISGITVPDAPQMPQYRNYQVTKTGATDDNFFYAFEATAKTQAAMSAVTYADGGAFEYATIAAGDTTWTAVFAKQGKLAGPTLTYNFTVAGKHRVVVTDLPENTIYHATVRSGNQTVFDRDMVKADAQGVLTMAYSAIAPGTVTLDFSGADPDPTGPGEVTAIENDAGAHRPSLDTWTDNQRVIHVSLTLPHASSAAVALYDMNGRMVAQLSRHFDEGPNNVSIDGAGLPTGLYLIRLTTPDALRTTRKIFLK